MTLTTVGTDDTLFDFVILLKLLEPLLLFDDVDEDDGEVSISLFLLGFGGNAGRILSTSAVDTIGVVFMLGATMFTLGLYDTVFGPSVTEVGATLLIGLRGGTTKFPDGS